MRRLNRGLGSTRHFSSADSGICPGGQPIDGVLVGACGVVEAEEF